MSDPPVAPRPRPPRSKSSRLGSSQTSSKETVAPKNVLDALSLPDDIKPSTSAHHLVLIGALETLTPPATPPLAMTPTLEALELSQTLNCCSHTGGNLVPLDNVAESSTTQLQRENSGNNVQSARELESLLAEAREIIDKRERELGIAASVGKSLLDSNIALRAKQDALLQRVREQTHLLDEDFASAALSPSTSPKSAKGKERASQLPFKSLHSLHIPAAYGAHGELVEGRPPPSPRTSLGRSTLRDLMEPKGDISTLFAHRRNASNASTSSLHSVSPVTSPSQKGVNPTSLNSALHRSHGHHRRSSSSSALGYTESASGLKSMSRSSSTKSIAELHHVNAAQQRLLSEEIQRLQLSEQNAELETRLQELEYEVSRADATGRKKLRRLDKELMGLKKELESALERNKELEDRLDRREGGKNAASGRYDRIRPSHSLPEVRIRTSSANSEHFRPDCSMPTVNESCMPTDTDVDADAVGLTHLLGADFINHAATSANDTDREATFSPVAVLDVDPMAADSIVSQLLTKINELQEANLQISAHKEALNEELLAASSQFDDMRRKYEFLEERVIEAEIRNHRILELEDGDPISEDALLAIQWPEHDSLILRHPDSISPATKLKRKAVGNRPRIEQYRRLSSLYSSQAGSENLFDPISSYSSPPRKGISGPRNSRNVTPLQDKTSSTVHLSKPSPKGSCLSPSPARSSSSKARSRAGSFFDANAAQDFITNIRGHIQTAHEALSTVYDPDQAAAQGLNTASVEDNVFITKPGPSTSKEIANWMEKVDATNNTRNPGKRLQAFSRNQSPSTISVDRGHQLTPEEVQEEEKDYLGDLLPDGPADAQTYDDLQSTLRDLAVQWEDNCRRTNVKLIGSRLTSRYDREVALPWSYEDGDSDNSENDPWKDDSGHRQAIESPEEVLIREKAEAGVIKRRKRLQELAQQILDDENTPSVARIEDRLALVKIDSNDSDASHRTLARRKGHSSENSSGFEEVETTKRPSGRGTDYWPVAYKARYAPTVVVRRVQKTSQEYLGICLLWTKFLVVLAVAVVFSIWRGPEAGLGVRRRSRRQLQQSNAGKSGAIMILRKAQSSDSDVKDDTFSETI